MDGPNNVRLRQRQQVIVTFQIRGMAGEARAAVIRFLQFIGLDYGTHGAIQDQDPGLQLRLQSGQSIVIRLHLVFFDIWFRARKLIGPARCGLSVHGRAAQSRLDCRQAMDAGHGSYPSALLAVAEPPRRSGSVPKTEKKCLPARAGINEGSAKLSECRPSFAGISVASRLPLARLGVFFLGFTCGLGFLRGIGRAGPEHIIGELLVAVFAQFQYLFEQRLEGLALV